MRRQHAEPCFTGAGSDSGHRRRLRSPGQGGRYTQNKQNRQTPKHPPPHHPKFISPQAWAGRAGHTVKQLRAKGWARGDPKARPNPRRAVLDLRAHQSGFVAVCSRGACIIRAAVTRWPARRLLFGGSRAYSSVLVAVRSHVDNRGMLYYAPRRSGALESLHTRLSQPLQNGAFRNAYIPARAPPLQRGSLAAHRSHTTFPVLLSSHAHTLRSMPPSGLLPRKTTNVALCDNNPPSSLLFAAM